MLLSTVVRTGQQAPAPSVDEGAAPDMVFFVSLKPVSALSLLGKTTAMNFLLFEFDEASFID